MYDPYAKVDEFINNFGDYGLYVLDSYNAVDPFNCYYGVDVNPDEYLSYAKRFMLATYINKGLYESVVASFHISQWEEGFITTDKALKIANLINIWIDHKANLTR